MKAISAALRLMCGVLIAAALAGCSSHKKAQSYKPKYNKVVYTFPQSDDDATQRLLSEAKMWLGTPYRYGGNDSRGVDCSGLVTQIYLRALGIKLPRVSRDQADFCTSVSRERLVPGDLVFFATGRDRSRISHVGMFLGDGKMIHSSNSNGVVVADILTGYFDEHFRKAGRVEAFHKMRKTPPAKPSKQKKEKPKKEKKEKKRKAPAAAGTASAPTPTPSVAKPERSISVEELTNMSSGAESVGSVESVETSPAQTAPAKQAPLRKGQRRPTPPPTSVPAPAAEPPSTRDTQPATVANEAPAPKATQAPATPATPATPAASKPAPKPQVEPASQPQSAQPTSTSTEDARSKVLSRLKLE